MLAWLSNALVPTRALLCGLLVAACTGCAGGGIVTSVQAVSESDGFPAEAPATYTIKGTAKDAQPLHVRLIKVAGRRYFAEFLTNTNGKFLLFPVAVFFNRLADDWYAASVDMPPFSSPRFEQRHFLVRIDGQIDALMDPGLLAGDALAAAAKNHGLETTGATLEGKPERSAFLAFLDEVQTAAERTADVRNAFTIAPADARPKEDYENGLLAFSGWVTLLNDYLLRENPVYAADLLEYATDIAARNDGIGNYLLALLLANGGTAPPDYAKARANAEQAVALGVDMAKSVLGALVLHGLGGPADEARGLALLTEAGDAGDPRAMFILAKAYFDGDDVDADSEKGFRWLQRSADAGLQDAEVELGRRYLRGDGIAKDPAKALAMLGKASEHREAFFLLGSIYGDGIGVDADQSKATGFYRKAAEAGHIPAEYTYGARLFAGTGVAADPDAGLEWIRRAAGLGDEDAKAALPLHEEQALLIKQKKAVDDAIAATKADMQKTCELLRESCGGRICATADDGRTMYQTVNGRFWYFGDGAMAPQSMWKDFSTCYPEVP